MDLLEKRESGYTASFLQDFPIRVLMQDFCIISVTQPGARERLSLHTYRVVRR